MHEQFAFQARQVMILAARAARGANRTCIWPKDILLALLGDVSSHCCAVLIKIGVNIPQLRESVEVVTREDESNEEGDSRKQADACEVIRLAKREAEKEDYDHVETQHLLAGLLQVSCGVITDLLFQVGVTLSAVRREAHNVSFRVAMRALSSEARDVCRRDIERGLLPSLRRYDRLIDELDKEVFDAAHDPSDTNADHQQERASDPSFQPEVRIFRDETMRDRNALASILKLKTRSPHSFEPRDY